MAAGVVLVWLQDFWTDLTNSVDGVFSMGEVLHGNTRCGSMVGSVP